MRRLFIDKIENMRDIGGYAVGDNKVVKVGKIIRTNCPTNLNNKDLKKLIDMGFKTIIDLRSDEEIKDKKSIFFNNPKFEYNHININGDGRLPESKEKILDSYIEMLDGKEKIKKFFDILNETENGIIYYCNAGKDRTGVMTACILKLLGVDNKDIIADYLVSGVFLKEKLLNYANSMKDRDIYPIINPNYDTMNNLLNYIVSKYGSIEGYLRECDISNEIIENVKIKYITEFEI